MNLLVKFFQVGGATTASRVLGFVREALIAALLGIGPVADAFYAAFRFPNLFRRIFAEGAFNSAFVPLFAKELEGGGKSAARQFAEQILSVLLLALLVMSALALIFMPFLVATVIAPKFVDDPAKFDLTVLLTRIMFPYLTLMSLVAMLSGVLNSFRKYFLPALAPVLLNVVSVLVLLGAMQAGVDQYTTGIWLAIAVVVSGVLQLFLLIYGMRKQDFSLFLRRPKMTPAVKRMLWLALPAAISGGIGQINLLIGQIIASGQDGAIATMNYADRIYQLPYGIVGVSIGVVLLPELSRALKANELQEATNLQNNSLEFGLALTIPATIAFMLFAEPLIALVFERGAFDRENTILVSQVLMAFAPGLPALILFKVFTPGFYAREDMKTPMWYAAINTVVNTGLSLILFPRLGVVGIGIATSVAGWVYVLLLSFTLWRRDLFRLARTTLSRIVKMIFASIIMGAFLWYANHSFSGWLLDGHLLTRVLAILIVIAISCVLYFGIALAIGGIEKSYLMKLVRRKK